MNTYRNDLEAALQRVVALEYEVERVKREHERIKAERDELQTEVRRLRSEVDRLRYRWSESDDGPRDPRNARLDKTVGDDIVADAFAAARSREWIAAFEAIRRLSATHPNHPRLPELLDRLYCQRCKRVPRQPEFSVSPSRYARFWNGRCPKCEEELILRL